MGPTFNTKVSISHFTYHLYITVNNLVPGLSHDLENWMPICVSSGLIFEGLGVRMTPRPPIG